MTTTAQPAIIIDKVRRSFGSVRPLAEVSFIVAPRSIFGLLGANGAGQTTPFSLAADVLRAA